MFTQRLVPAPAPSSAGIITASATTTTTRTTTTPTTTPTTAPAAGSPHPGRNSSTSAAPSSASSAAAAAAAGGSSSGHKSSRLRGLTYLKNYTQTHLLNRDHSSSTSVSFTSASASTRTSTTIANESTATVANNLHHTGPRLLSSAQSSDNDNSYHQPPPPSLPSPHHLGQAQGPHYSDQDPQPKQKNNFSRPISVLTRSINNYSSASASASASATTTTATTTTTITAAAAPKGTTALSSASASTSNPSRFSLFSLAPTTSTTCPGLVSADHNHPLTSTPLAASTTPTPSSTSGAVIAAATASATETTTSLISAPTATTTTTATTTAETPRPARPRPCSFLLLPRSSSNNSPLTDSSRAAESTAVSSGLTASATTVATTITSATGTVSATMTRTRSATASDAAVLAAQHHANPVDSLPSIRFSTFYDPRATRPSLTFTPISRTLPTGSEVIRVGRYSERDAQPNVPVNVPSAAPVGFKSKVVSRRHCEFWSEGGKWYIKDVKSSSGTFLNHIRLSPPGTESKPFPVNDGDIVQLGIDFKGGEEMIFRCVKMRLELNRGWQSKLNAFNMTTHKRLRNMTKSGEGGGSAQSSQDCSICLNSIAPCQSLFVAPCSHTWHYKCIRSLLSSPQYPIFMCPNCRAAADLEAEVEDPEEWEQLDSEMEEEPNVPAVVAASVSEEGNCKEATPPALSSPAAPGNNSDAPPPPLPPSTSQPPMTSDGQDGTILLQVPTTSTSTPSPPPPPPPPPPPLHPSESLSLSSSHATSQPVPIPRVPSTASTRRFGGGDGALSTPVAAPDAVSSMMQPHTNTPGHSTPSTGDCDRQTRTPSPTGVLHHPNGSEGPITPRNDAGPWVFDGSGVRMRVSPPTTAAPTATTTTMATATPNNVGIPIGTGHVTSLDDIARA